LTGESEIGGGWSGFWHNKAMTLVNGEGQAPADHFIEKSALAAKPGYVLNLTNASSDWQTLVLVEVAVLVILGALEGH
jgi:hypothetical protein